MKLRYILIYLDSKNGYSVNYNYFFKLNTRFISHYLSIQIRKDKITTKGFNMISVEPLENGKLL